MILDVYKQLSPYPKRLLHVINVALIAKSLAIKYNVNSDDAFIAGLFHDYSKYESDEFHTKFITNEILDKYTNDKMVYHGFSAANYLLEKYKINNDIYLSVYNHVFGRPNMTTLEKIIFVSDSIYLTGYNNTSYMYKTALVNLNKAVVEALEATFNYLKKMNVKPSIYQLETYNFYKEEKQ